MKKLSFIFVFLVSNLSLAAVSRTYEGPGPVQSGELWVANRQTYFKFCDENANQELVSQTLVAAASSFDREKVRIEYIEVGKDKCIQSASILDAR